MRSVSDAQSDDIFYEQRLSLSGRLSLIARTRIYQTFMKEMKPTEDTSILDIGASDVDVEEANLLEKQYPYPQNITCGTIGSSKSIEAHHPLVKIAQLSPNSPLPFPDKAFDIAYSNAVLEHVGGPQQRKFLIQEAMRVAAAVFFVVPNRWFPVEHHTAIPFLHFMPSMFRAALSRTGLSYWTKVENLDFLSRRTLKNEWPQAITSYDGIPLGPFSSNVVIIRR
jgi:SAM-dependent methyltransferase